MMTTAAIVALISGPFLSMLISFILGRGFSKNVGVALTVVACVVVALATTFMGDGFVWTHFASSSDLIKTLITDFAILYASALSFYKGISVPTGLNDKLNNVGPQVGN